MEFARDDLLDRAMCILTQTKTTNRSAVKMLKGFWSELGCRIKTMTPAEHDRVYAHVSHLPQLIAVALVNANRHNDLKFAGKGFIDTSRIASGPANIWADVLLTNSKNVAHCIDKAIVELKRLQKGIRAENRREIETMLEKARSKRNALIEYKIKNKEILP